MHCPVCDSPTDALARHHDHFSDFCSDLIRKANIPTNYGSGYDYQGWKTFADTKICPACNAICPEVKRNTSALLPKFVSFSPIEMRTLLDSGLAQERATRPVQQYPPPYWKQFAVQIKRVVQEIWIIKKETYRPKIRKLVALGVTKDAITAAWNDRSPTSFQNGSKNTRAEMLRLLEDAPLDFKALCESPGHDQELAWCLYKLRWPSQYANNFVYWYHVQHGDSYLRNNRLELGPLAFRDWFVALSQGDVEKAQRIISKDAYWKRRRA